MKRDSRQDYQNGLEIFLIKQRFAGLNLAASLDILGLVMAWGKLGAGQGEGGRGWLFCPPVDME